MPNLKGIIKALRETEHPSKVSILIDAIPQVLLLVLLILSIREVSYSIANQVNTDPEYLSYTVNKVMRIVHIVSYSLLILWFFLRSKDKNILKKSFFQSGTALPLRVGTLCICFSIGVLYCAVKYSIYVYIYPSSEAHVLPYLLDTIFERFIVQFFNLNSVLAFSGVCLFSPMLEEIICRFHFQRHFQSAFSYHVSMILSSCIYVFMHFSTTLLAVAFHFISAFLFAWIMFKSGSVLCAFLAHSGMNTFVFVIERLYFDGIPGLTFFIASAILLLVAVLLFIRIGKAKCPE